ncbi:hypothetical protein [Solicola gregarius]|uniref:Uncharacterized protein n=1 Tax=Solicola gregarius TaxID=2908642 RepID=A0AA46TJ04_9ACTN|nr:hypothetical protein [Solicola gregarius]UYM06145.1 hypothetical protein L0C25_03470 [Solicola gregarius]
MSEQSTEQQPPGPPAGLSDKGFLICQWVLGGACAIAVIIAVVLSVAQPSLTYKSIPPDFEEEVTVKCSTSGAVVDRPQLADPASMPLNYEIADGNDVFDAWQEYEAKQQAANSDVFAASRGINSDCARADTARLRHTVWVLALGVTLAIGFAWLSIARSRNNEPPELDGDQ